MDSSALQRRLLPTLALLVATLLWGSSFIALKASGLEADILTVIFGRMVVAVLCFLPFLMLFWKFRYQKGDLALLTLMVLGEPCLYFLFEAEALRWTSASQAAVIVSLLPPMVSVAAWLILKERITRRSALGLVIAAGCAMALGWLGPSTDSAPNPLLGNFLEFCAMLTAVVYVLTVKRLTERYNPWFLTFLQSAGGVVFFGAIVGLNFAAPMPGFLQARIPEVWSTGLVVGIVYLGAAVSLGAYGLYNFAISRVPASQASAFANLIPTSAIFLGWLFLGERLTGWQLAACGGVILGVILSQRITRKERSAAATETGKARQEDAIAQHPNHE